MPKRTKAKVIIAFALRLLLIPPSASRLAPLHGSVFAAHPAAFIVRLQVLSLFACQVSVISATIPCAKPFFSVFSSGIMGRPRASILPTSRPTMQREISSGGSMFPHPSRDRNSSINVLRLRPTDRGITFASAEHVLVTSPTQRPSLVNSKHSDNSIAYSKDFEVSFQDVGGLLNRGSQDIAQRPGMQGRGSSAGCSWSRKSGRRISSQKSNPDSSQPASPAVEN